MAGVARSGGDAAIDALWDGPGSAADATRRWRIRRRWVRRVVPGAHFRGAASGALTRRLSADDGVNATAAARAAAPTACPRRSASRPSCRRATARRTSRASRDAAPGSRASSRVSLEGLADGDLTDVEVMLRGPLPAGVFDRLLGRCPNLMWVHSATAGVERVLTPAALERGLAITNARGVFSDPIAEYVLMMILAVSRRLPQLLELQRERTWQPLPGREMRDITVGVVGLGSIGRRVAELGARRSAARRGHRGARAGGESADGVDGRSIEVLPPDAAARADGARATSWSWRCR